MTTVCVFGGTGFLGQRLVRRLASEGTAVRVAVRHPDRAPRALRGAGLERVTLFGADVRDQAAVPAPWLVPTPSSTRSLPMLRRAA